MSETFPANSPEQTPTFVAKKETIIVHLEQRLRDMNARDGSIERSKAWRQKYHKSNPPLDKIPDHVVRDGGSDLSDWRAEVGADRHSREHGDEDDERQLENLDRDIDGLEQDLNHIKDLEDNSEYDDRWFDHLFQEAEAAKK